MLNADEYLLIGADEINAERLTLIKADIKCRTLIGAYYTRQSAFCIKR